MSSNDPSAPRPVPDDRSTAARIRDAAIVCFAEHGVADTTARKVAAEAGVSAGSVIHHFGSMDGLRRACDEHVVAVIRHLKSDAMAQGPMLDIVAAMRAGGGDVGPLLGYLARVLVDDADAVTALVDDLVDDAVDYFRQGVEHGLIRPTEDERGRAVVLVLWSLGGLVLHRHFQRLLGVDLTDPNLEDSPAIARYALPVYELFGSGFLTEEFARQATRALAELQAAATASTP